MDGTWATSTHWLTNPAVVPGTGALAVNPGAMGNLYISTFASNGNNNHFLSFSTQANSWVRWMK